MDFGKLAFLLAIYLAPGLASTIAKYRMFAFRRDCPSAEYFGTPYWRRKDIYSRHNYSEEGQRILARVIVVDLLCVPWFFLFAYLIAF
ncbi:MAG TPA: hypothetical protein VE913_02835 [Longimicrobium sp.]|nr:hypothetical protein [Longimicrobium sp.]